MDNFANGVWQNVNNEAIASIINGASAYGSFGSQEAKDEKKKSILLEVDNFDWKPKVVSYSMYLDTAEMSHILAYTLSCVFDDVWAGYVSYNPAIGRIMATLYFEYGAQPKSEKGLVAFKPTIDNTNMPDNLPDQLLIRMQQQDTGNLTITSQARDVLSDLIYLPVGVARIGSNWANKINWRDYVDYVPEPTVKNGFLIRVSGIDITRIMGKLINTLKEEVTDSNGNKKEICRPLEVAVKPGPFKVGSPESIFEVIIVDREKAQKILETVTPQQYAAPSIPCYR